MLLHGTVSPSACRQHDTAAADGTGPRNFHYRSCRVRRDALGSLLPSTPVVSGSHTYVPGKSKKTNGRIASTNGTSYIHSDVLLPYRRGHNKIERAMPPSLIVATASKPAQKVHVRPLLILCPNVIVICDRQTDALTSRTLT